jgi:Tol biopolymer transport system component
MQTMSSLQIRTRCVVVALALLACIAGLVAPGRAATSPKTSRADVSSAGVESNQGAGFFALSTTGRYVAFDSRGTNLVTGDGNATWDVFVRDKRTGTTKRVSLTNSGGEANGPSFDPAISGGGRYVAFHSEATNLVSGDGNGFDDIFVRDRRTRKTRRVSVSSGGTEANADCYGPGISADGRYVVFVSEAGALAPGDINDLSDVFMHDRVTRRTTRISVGPGGVLANGASGLTDNQSAISGNGRYVVFQSNASNLVPADTNVLSDVFIRDRKTRTTRRISVSSRGRQGNGSSYNAAISPNGRYLVFTSDADNLVPRDTNAASDIFVRDRKTHTTRLVSRRSGGTQANNTSNDGGVSADGRFVVFASDASDLVLHDTNLAEDIFLRDRKTGRTRRISVGPAGAQANDGSLSPALSADGRFAGFYSAATNLVGSDLNGFADVFLRGPLR